MDPPDIETDTTSRSNIEPLQDLVVVGEKKDWNPIEEFWMQKLTKVEEQYETHMVNLERALLENKVHRRVLNRQDNQLTTLKKQYTEKSKESDTHHAKSASLKKEVSLQQIKNEKLEGKLTHAVSKFMNTERSTKTRKVELRKCSREIQGLRKKLKQLEKEKAMLTKEVKVKEGEKGIYRERESDLWKRKANVLKTLKAVDTERIVQTTTNLQLTQSIVNVLEDTTLRDRRILSLRRELEEILQAMKKQRIAHEETINIQRNTEKNFGDTKEQLEKSQKKLDDLHTQVLSWKEEMDYKETTERRQDLELTKVKSENRALRSQVAELSQHLTKLQHDLKSFEVERVRLGAELRKMKSQDISIQNLMRQNAFQKIKLGRKIPELPKIQMVMENDLDKYSRPCQGKEIEGYKKKIWELERNLKIVERKIEEGKRRENSYLLRLQRFSSYKEQLFWTQRAMLRLEADRQGMEQMIQSFSRTIPNKVPFEKLVTDPSILDRIAKHKVLQQRLASQSSKVEHMKEITQHLIQNEERRRAEGFDGFTRQIPGLQPWQLNYWRQQIQRDAVNAMDSETKQGYYKDYMGFLKQEIPRIRSDLITLERKKQYLRLQRAASESRSASVVSVVDLDAEDHHASSIDEQSEESEEEEEEEEAGDEEDKDNSDNAEDLSGSN